MSQAQAVAGTERLPWLADEPIQRAPKEEPRRKTRKADMGGGWALAGWAFAAMLLVAIASYWMGAHSWERSSAPKTVPPSTTLAVPRPQTAVDTPRQPEVALEPAPEVNPAPVHEVPIARPKADKRFIIRRAGPLKRETPSTAALDKVETTQKAVPAPAKPQATTAVKPAEKPLTAWPATQSQGAAGRIVRIGAFGTRDQAKLGWRRMVRAYPAVAHLNATVVSDRNSRGRYFYRFQIGTTSQAHSEVLCQRMEKIRLSCAVVGLPWKPRGVER